MKLLIVFLSLFAPVAFACTQIAQEPYEPSSYYSFAQGKSGVDLKSALNVIIKDHQDYSYSPCVWTILEVADEDPNNSNNVIGFYTRRSISKSDRDRGGNTPNAWNREHIWPRSHGFRDRDQHAHNDVHHLRATDKSVNADRADHDFANGGSPNSECNLCNQTGSTWESPDLVKGDTARMMFYMATRYEGGDDSMVSDLELLDQASTSGNRMGKLCDLVQWHINDPVSQEELTRNQIIYEWQGNRNPYIDHPEFVLSIWGSECGIAVPTPTPISSPVIEEAEIDEDVPLPVWALGLLAAVLAFFKMKIKR